MEQVRDSLGNLDLSEQGVRSRSGAADEETAGADVEVGMHKYGFHDRNSDSHPIPRDYEYAEDERSLSRSKSMFGRQRR